MIRYKPSESKQSKWSGRMFDSGPKLYIVVSRSKSDGRHEGTMQTEFCVTKSFFVKEQPIWLIFNR